MEDKDKIIKEINELKDRIVGSYSQLDPDLSDGTKKLVNCKHEIIFNIKARVLEENDVGEAVGTKSICVKNYHIPVPSDKDYNIYMKAFFDHLESCIASSAKLAKESDSNQ